MSKQSTKSSRNCVRHPIIANSILVYRAARSMYVELYLLDSVSIARFQSVEFGPWIGEGPGNTTVGLNIDLRLS